MNKIIKQLDDIISKEFEDFHGLYFYGSRFSGANTAESDYDVVALFDVVNEKKKNEIYRILSEFEYLNDVFIDIKIFDENQFHSNPFFYEQVTQKGVFYAKG